VAVASQWAIENQPHWQLDVTFREDHCRIRTGHADANFSTLGRTAVSIPTIEKTEKLEIKSKRLSAGWHQPYLFKVL
jgi:predicted transposase YbfD/YdcC